MKSSDIGFLVITGVLFGLFILDILLGKMALVFDTEPILSAGDVGEFLLLLAAVIFFVIEVLRQESQQSNAKTQSTKGTEEDN